MESHDPPSEPTTREGFAPVEGGALYYRDIGRGQPIIVLHGGPGFGHNYLLPDMDRLADAFRLIYYDQRGRGRSTLTVRPEEISIQSEMNDLEDICAYFGLEHIALMGHSWGGLLALEFALRHPERVSHLILMNTAPASHADFMLFEQALDANAPEDMKTVRELQSSPASEEGDPEVRAEINRIYFRATLRPPELLERLIEHLRLGWTKVGILRERALSGQLWRDTAESPEYDLLPQLTRLRNPTLILHGDYDFIPLVCASHIAAAIPGARLVVLPDCGHFSYLECPDAVRQAVSGFLQAS